MVEDGQRQSARDTAPSRPYFLETMKRSKQLTRRQRQASRADRGYPYQQLVSEVARAFHPEAEVTQDSWIDGPDGRLDLDVAIRWRDGERSRLCVIECKDYDRSRTGKVGRPIVDALDSKRRDLEADSAIICSNSGFTADALHKASRVGIGMISVLRSGDNRVKFVAEDEQYICRITIGDYSFSYDFAEEGIDLRSKITEPRYQGLPTNRWLTEAMKHVALANPGCTEPITCTFRMITPLTCQVDGADVTMRSATVQFSHVAEWYVRRVRLDLANGLYDHIRSALRMAPGPNSASWAPLDEETETRCEPANVPPPSRVGPGECEVGLAIVQNFHVIEEGCPNLRPLIVPEDLTLHVEGVDYCRNDRERRTSEMLRTVAWPFAEGAERP